MDRRSSLPIFWRYAIGVSVLWTTLVVSSLIWNTAINKKQGQQLLHKEAHTIFDKDQAFRLWGTQHGGAYVPITDETPPSPYMAHIPERDITTPSGKKLTLMNPAYMSRQLMEEYEELYGIKGKITALVLLRPENAPDEWERQALRKLKAGAEEVVGTNTIADVPYLRFMHPLFMEPGCEKCHGHLGFKTGDFRGGVSISVPATPYIEANQDTFHSLATTHLIGWLLGLIGITLTCRQIHRQIKIDIDTERELRRSEHTLSEILRISPSALLTTKSDGTITQYNEGATRIFGYSSDEIIGRPVSTLIPKKYRPAHGQYFKDFEAAENPNLTMRERTSIAGRRRDGTQFPAAASVSKLTVGEQTYFTVALYDLTEQVQKEEEILEARDLAEVANRSKSEFLANMSHEVRTPLTAIKGMLELIDTSKSSSEDKRYIQVARTASDSVLVIINDILDLARLEAGRTELEFTSFELREFIADIQDLLRGSVEQKGIVFRINFPGENPVWIKSDIQRLRQILINLVGNASKFTDEGEISLNVSVGQQIDNCLDLEISVKDTGIGIRQKDLSRLFERFEQDDSSSTRKHQGTGLGLSICRQLTTLMNGVIDATSIYGEGSTFTIRITCEVGQPGIDTATTTSKPESEYSPLHILVAEDNKVNQLLASKFLERLGHTFDFVENGKEALDTYVNSPSDSPYDAILMDMQMPVMDGPEATRQIRSQSQRPNNVPIIALTADVMNLNQDKYHDIALNGYITKPYSLADLEAELDRVMQEWRANFEQDPRSDQNTIAS